MRPPVQSFIARRLARGLFGGVFDIEGGLLAVAASGSGASVGAIWAGFGAPPSDPRDVDFLDHAHRHNCQARTNRRRLAKLQATPDGGPRACDEYHAAHAAPP